MSVEKHDWRELCEEASKENDSDKLMNLVSEIVKALDEQKGRSATFPRNA